MKVRLNLFVLTFVFAFLCLSPMTAHAQEIRARPPLTILDVAYSPNSQRIARIIANGTLVVSGVASNNVQFEFNPGGITQLRNAKLDWSPTGDRLAAGIGAIVYVWSVPNFRLIQSISAGGEEPLVYFEADYYSPEGFVSLQWDTTGTLLMAKSVSSRLTVFSLSSQTFIVDIVYRDC